MGKLGMMWTWIVSYWLGKIHLGRLWSKVAKWKSTVEFHSDKTVSRHVEIYMAVFELWETNKHMYMAP